MFEVLYWSSWDWIYLFLFGVAIIAGVVDAIAGGGGLITVPSLMLVGLPPMTALGTNRLQAVIGELTTSVMFLSSQECPKEGVWLGLIFTTVGAVFGTVAVGLVDKGLLEILLPVLMVIIACYSLFSQKLKFDGQAKALIANRRFMIMCGLLLGFYNGFFGPGTGSFWMLSFVTLLGYTIKQATMATKPLNLIGNVISLVVFVYLNQVDYKMGMMMGAGQIIGSFIGSKCVFSFGNKLIRPVFISVTLIMTTKIIYENVTMYGFV